MEQADPDRGVRVGMGTVGGVIMLAAVGMNVDVPAEIAGFRMQQFSSGWVRISCHF